MISNEFTGLSKRSENPRIDRAELGGIQNRAVAPVGPDFWDLLSIKMRVMQEHKKYGTDKLESILDRLDDEIERSVRDIFKETV